MDGVEDILAAGDLLRRLPDVRAGHGEKAV
jgi:hypothetical protein